MGAALAGCGGGPDIKTAKGCVECKVVACLDARETKVERLFLTLRLGEATDLAGVTSAWLRIDHPLNGEAGSARLDPTGWRTGVRFTLEEISPMNYRRIGLVEEWEQATARLLVRRGEPDPDRPREKLPPPEEWPVQLEVAECDD